MTSTDTPTVMMDKLAEAAWAQLADMSPRALHIDEIAAAAGILDIGETFQNRLAIKPCKLMQDKRRDAA